MKQTTLLFLFFFLGNLSHAQDTTYYYYHNTYKSWSKTTNKDSAESYQVIYPVLKDKTIFPFEKYAMDGTIKMKGHFSDKEIEIYDGLITSYYSNGMKQQELEFREGAKHGKCIEYYQDGTLRARGIYENRKPMNGLFLQNNPYGNSLDHGSLEYFEYKNNKIVGGYTTYTNSKQIAIESKFDSLNQQVIRTAYDRSGNLIGEYSYDLGYKNQNGKEIYFHKNHTQASTVNGIITYKNDLKDGEHIRYDTSGQILIKGIYKEGKEYQGTFFLSSNAIGKYSNGVLEEATFYNNNEEEIAKGFYKDNEKWEGTFLENGAIHTYKKGIPNGKVIYFYDINSQKVSSIHHYIGEIRDGETIRYKENGEIICKGIYKNNEKWEGNFYENDDVFGYKLSSYLNGLLDGIQSYYNSDDELRYGFEYKKGKNTGWKNSWNPFDKTIHRVYDDDCRTLKPTKGESFLISTLKKYDNNQLIERIEYFNDKRYSLIYKNDNPYDGLYIRLFFEKYEFIYYKKGKKKFSKEQLSEKELITLLEKFKK